MCCAVQDTFNLVIELLRFGLFKKQGKIEGVRPTLNVKMEGAWEPSIIFERC